MKHVVYIVSDPYDKERLLELVTPLEAAGFSVVHNEAVGVGDSLIDTAARHLRGGIPVVLCATVHAVARRWARKVVNAAQSIDGCKVLVVEMDEGLDLDHLSLGTVAARYYADPIGAVNVLIATLNAYFPEDSEELAPLTFDEQQDFLDQISTAATPSIEALAEFRGQMREDIVAEYPQSLSAWEFLQRTYLVREGRLTRTGVLLVGEKPEQVMPSAVIECCEYHGTDRFAASTKITIFGTLQSQIVQANKYTAGRVQRGEAPSPTGPYAQPVYAYPMIAIREVIANAVAHRNYSAGNSCIHVRIFEDRIEVTNPGRWMGQEIGTEEPRRIDGLAGESSRQNFRLASMLTWIRLVEGEGKGILAMTADCQTVDAPIPTVRESNGIITVTVFPIHRRVPEPFDLTTRDAVQVGVLPLLSEAFQDRKMAYELVDNPDRAGTTAILSGMGGVGKTQIAAQYATAVWQAGGVDLLVWLTAGGRPAILSAYGQTMRRIESGDPTEDAEAVAQRFLAWLDATDRPWLVVLDDLADPADMKGLWPQGRSGRTVVTTRRRDAILGGGGRTIVELGVFTPDEALAYLTAKLDGNPDWLEQAAELAEDLGFLPLALAQAAAYIRDRSLTCAEYRARFASQRRTSDDMFPPEALPDDYPRTVTVTWSLSIQQADQLRPVGLASPALQLAALLNPNGIPEIVFASSANRTYLATHRAPTAQRPSSGDAEADDAVEVSTEDALDALHSLDRFSLLTVDRDSPFRMARVHALVQRVVREHLTSDELHATARAAADALLQAWPERDVEHAMLSQALRDCTDSLRDQSGQALWSPDAHPVIFRCGRSIGNVGLVGQAATYWKDVVTASTQNLGADHPTTLEARVNLASWRENAADAHGAVRALEELLADCQRLLEPGHPVTLETRIQLARWRGETMDATGAVQALEELLAEQSRTLGPGHRQTLRTRHELAYWRGYGGDVAGAIQQLADLLPDCQRVLGRDDPEVLSIRADLAFRQGLAGDPATAAQSFAEIVTDSERVNGTDHPATLNYRGNLARWRGDAGDPAGTVQAFTELLTDSARILGPDHQHVLNIRSDLAHYQGMAGDAAGAVRALQELVPDYLRVLGPDHWETLTNRDRLAHWQGIAGDPAGAARIYAELLTDRLRILGSDHADTMTTRANLADWRRWAL